METESDWCALRFQTTRRLHGNAQRWESNKAINNIGHLLVQDKIEVEGALTRPLLLLLLLSLQLSFHRHIEEENSQQSQCEEHASLCPRHLSRLLLTSPTRWQLKIFTFSLYRPFPESTVYNALILSRCPVRLRAFSLKKSLTKAGLTKSFSFSWEKKRSEAGQDKGEERHPRKDAKLHFNSGKKTEMAVSSYDYSKIKSDYLSDCLESVCFWLFVHIEHVKIKKITCNWPTC